MAIKINGKSYSPSYADAINELSPTPSSSNVIFYEGKKYKLVATILSWINTIYDSDWSGSGPILTQEQFYDIFGEDDTDETRYLLYIPNYADEYKYGTINNKSVEGYTEYTSLNFAFIQRNKVDLSSAGQYIEIGVLANTEDVLSIMVPVYIYKPVE